MVKIPAPETDFLDPRTGKLSQLWYQYLQQLDRATTQVIQQVTYGSVILQRATIEASGVQDGEPGPRGFRGPPGRDGVTRIVHVYLPSDEGEHSHVQRRG